MIFPVVRVLAQPGLTEWWRLFTDPRWLRLGGNTFLIAVLSTASAVALGFLFAYATSRPDVPLRHLFKLVAILPLVSPPFVGGLAFILLFGRRGLVTYSLLGLSGDIYGWHGLWMVQTLAFFPIAYLSLAGVLRRINPTLEYAAQDLGVHGLRLFCTVTLPLATPGLASAALLVGIYTLSDFGNPMLVGGAFKVLATETYTQITGWGDIGMAAALSAALLLPSLVLFASNDTGSRAAPTPPSPARGASRTRLRHRLPYAGPSSRRAAWWPSCSWRRMPWSSSGPSPGPGV